MPWHGVLWRSVAAVALLCLLVATVASATPTSRLDKPQRGEPPGNVSHDVSPPLRDIPPAPDSSGKQKKEKEPKKGLPVPAQSPNDPVVQSSAGTASAPTLGVGFEGVGQGFSGPSGTFAITSAPPDPNAAVGPNNIVELVNTDFAVFDKTGTALYGPVPTNTLWSGFGGGCQTNNDGDGTVAYDRIANRWIISQFSVSSTPYLQCVAVSTSGDPTGSYNRYSFQYTDFPDYPKLGVWPDAYYTTFNMFNSAGTQFRGGEVCAYDRTKMLAGQAATQQCFNVGTTYGGLLPSDLDGARAPPAGSPNYVLSFATNSLQLWKFHVDWTTPASTTLTGPTNIPVAAFSPACSGGGTCIRQPGTTQRLDSLADRLMYRLAYRNFGDHEALVVNHSVTAGSSVGVRWYELRVANGTPSVFQQGTYAPDSSYRWMGSVAMDQKGDIALGFSASSSSVFPGIRVTGRLAGDAAGLMTQGETTIVSGAGSQTGSLSRWGDYTSMSVDPADDCTFWYTNEYLAANGSFNWHTRIGSFRLPNCGGVPQSDFSISAGPGSVSVAQGGSGTSTISTAVTSGSAQAVALSASGQPAGTTVSFNPASVTAGGSSTMTINVGAGTATGTFTITVTGTGTSATHTASVSLTVTGTPQPLVNAGFETGNLSGWTAGGAFLPVISTTPHTGSFSARIGSTTAVNGDSTLTQTVTLPTGTPTLTFWYQPHCTDTITWDQIQMQVRSTAGATLATVLNVCSNSAAWTQVTFNLSTQAGQTVVLWFNDHDDGYPPDPTYFLLDDVSIQGGAPPPNDFSISASPASVSVVQGASGTSTISTAVTSGSAQSVALSASGVPAGASASFSPVSVTAGGSSTLTLNAGTATPGPYVITVTGTGTSATHSTTVNLTVTASPPPNDFSISASPSSVSVVQGASGTSTISTAVTSGSAQSVALSASGVPAGASTSFSPASVTAGGSSTLTLSAGTAAPGPYVITVTGTGTSATHSTTVNLTVTAPPNDFSISANPSNVSVLQGASGTSTISTAVTSGLPQTVALSASGLPAGASASFSPASVAAGSSSTLTLNAGTAAPGPYVITVTGTGTSATHSTTVTLTVTAGSQGVVNGGFETGDLSGWTASGVSTPVISTTAHHAGSSSARIGSASAFNGNSTLTQAVAVPSGNSRLTFWYEPHCTDTIVYDQIQMQVRSAAGATLAAVLNACSNSGVWTQVSFDLTAYAGQTVVLWFNVHDDGAAADPTYSFIDDVAITSYTGTPIVIQNPDFETGDLSGWTTSGAFAPVIGTTAHTGSYSARVGSTSAVNGDSTLAQTVVILAGTTTLTFWYQPHCTDTITYDQIQMQVRNNAGATLANVLNVCSNSGAWTQVSFNVSSLAGQTVVLWFNVHDDGAAADPTYFLLDDVALS